MSTHYRTHSAPFLDTDRGRWLALAGFLAICFAIGGLGALATVPNLGDWYLSLKRPTWTPPNWVFAPVWNTIYAMTAVSAWLVWCRVGFRREWFVPFSVQLALNLLWSVVFFHFHRPDFAFAVIGMLWASIAVMMAVFGQYRRTAALLLVPYLAWVTFAGVLNFAFWHLNA